MIGVFWGALAAVGFLLMTSQGQLQYRRPKIVVWSDILVSAVAAVLTLLFQVPVLALISFVSVLVALHQRRANAQQRIFQQRSEAWPDAIDFLISSIRAGMPIGASLIALQEEGPEILRPALLPARQALSNGATTADAIRLIRAHADDPIADRICLILEISQGVGGTALGAVLRSMSSYVRAESRTRAELISRQAWTINAAKLAVFAPWAIVLLLSLRAHEAYSTPTGSLLLLVGSLATSLGYGWMKRAARLPLAPRLS